VTDSSNSDKGRNTILEQIRNNLALIMVVVGMIFGYARLESRVSSAEETIIELKSTIVESQKDTAQLKSDIIYIKTTLDYIKAELTK
jgi:Sec-independent protein translocase protein TatA